MWKLAGGANRQEGRQRRQSILGLQRFPEVSVHGNRWRPGLSVGSLLSRKGESLLWIRADGAIAYVSGSIVLSLYIADRDYVREKILVPAKAKTTPAAKPVPTF